MENKNSALRNQARQRRLSLNPLQQKLAAKRLQQQLAGNFFFLNSKKVAFYSAVQGELDTQLLLETALKQGKNCYLPSVRPNTRQLDFFEIKNYSKLKAGAFDIPHLRHGAKIAVHQFDLVIMPLVAFDASGKRLGMGGGYYDFSFRHLNRHKKFRRTKLIGVAHKCQEVSEIETNEWDIQPNKIIAV